jgi:hypothetical protein
MKIKGLLIIGLLLTEGLVNAQTDFRPGYLIKSNGDTLIGEIDYRGDILMGEVCRFKTKNTDKETKYSPYDIDGYRFIQSKYFVSKEVNGEKIFLEFLIKGQINIYFFRDTQGDHYLLEKGSSGVIEIPYEKGIRYRDNVPYFYESTRHIGLFNYYMQDAPEFQKRIANIGEPKHKNLIKLAEDYHNIVCKDSACIIYEKKLPPIKLNIEVIGGIVSYQTLSVNSDRNYDYLNYGNYSNKPFFQSGILTHFWIPRTSEKFFIRTGLLYSTVHSNEGKASIYKIPIQFEYIYPKNIIRPKFAFGINIYSPFYQSCAFMGGVNIKMHRSVYLAINYDIDFNPAENFALFPKSILSQSILTGLLIML